MTKTKVLRLAALAAALTYFFDPQNGRRRRKVALGRLAGFLRRGRRLAAGPKSQPDDVTLARKVESAIFRDADVPKGKINVNAQHGVVVLRGEADTPEMIDDLAKKAKKVQGVRDVENLLHVPGS